MLRIDLNDAEPADRETACESVDQTLVGSYELRPDTNSQSNIKAVVHGAARTDRNRQRFFK